MPSLSHSAEPASPSARLRLSFQASLLIVLGLLLVVSVPGCNGCLPQDPLAKKKREEEERKKKDKQKEKPKPDFEIGRLRVQPRDATDTSNNSNRVKTGHWMAATQLMKANNFDFKAELESATTNRGGEPLDLPNTAFRLRLSRPATLPKGQEKEFETLYFVPSSNSSSDASSAGTVQTVWLQNKLRASRGGREVAGGMSPTSTMPSFQYFFVILAADQNRHGFLSRYSCMRPPVDINNDEFIDEIIHYRVIRPEIATTVTLPSQPLVWSSIAYLLWDGLNPNALTPVQQQSIVDWLHWGGQVIISGPDSMDLLKGSFLDKYLPAEGEQSISLDADAFATLNETWSLYNPLTQKRETLEVLAGQPMVGVDLTRHEEANFVDGTGDLVIERPIGAGRIVVTAFSLGDRSVLSWAGYDGFFNGCLMRRPARKFVPSSQTQYPTVVWNQFPGARGLQTDARFVTRVRYFSRDVGTSKLKDGENPFPVPVSSQRDVAGWNDNSGASSEARASLRDAAGISIPEAGFVFRVLAIYLIVLVPVNWGLFWLMGRVEWAWVAAPVIAIVGAIAVVRLAQLDIGFARSRTEIAVMEMQGGYPRGHLTRYTALYTSLSTAYDLHFDDDSALALPFPKQIPYERGLHDPVNTVQFRRDKQVSLSGFQVASNTTGMVHSEHMLYAGGAISLSGDNDSGWRVLNDSEMDLTDAGVLRRNESGQLQAAWIGQLAAKQAASLNFTTTDSAFCEQWKSSPTTNSYEAQNATLFREHDANDDKFLDVEELASRPEIAEQFATLDRNGDRRLDVTETLSWCIESRRGELTVGRLIELAAQSQPLERGTVRLVAWTDQELPGVSIRPASAQNLTKTMVLVHLRHGDWKPAEPDANLRKEFPEPDEENQGLEGDGANVGDVGEPVVPIR